MISKHVREELLMRGLPVPDSGSFLFAKGPRSEPVRRSLLISYDLLGLEIFILKYPFRLC